MKRRLILCGNAHKRENERALYKRRSNAPGETTPGPSFPVTKASGVFGWDEHAISVAGRIRTYLRFRRAAAHPYVEVDASQSDTPKGTCELSATPHQSPDKGGNNRK